MHDFSFTDCLFCQYRKSLNHFPREPLVLGHLCTVAHSNFLRFISLGMISSKDPTSGRKKWINRAWTHTGPIKIRLVLVPILREWEMAQLFCSDNCLLSQNELQWTKKLVICDWQTNLFARPVMKLKLIDPRIDPIGLKINRFVSNEKDCVVKISAMDWKLAMSAEIQYRLSYDWTSKYLDVDCSDWSGKRPICVSQTRNQDGLVL